MNGYEISSICTCPVTLTDNKSGRDYRFIVTLYNDETDHMLRGVGMTQDDAIAHALEGKA